MSLFPKKWSIALNSAWGKTAKFKSKIVKNGKKFFECFQISDFAFYLFS